jgi:hypothetical protein
MRCGCLLLWSARQARQGRPVETLAPRNATPLSLTMATPELAPSAGPLGVRKQDEPKWTIIVGNHWEFDIAAAGVA